MKKIISLSIIAIIFSCCSEKSKETKKDKTEKYKVPVFVKTIDYESFKNYFEASGTVEAIYDAFISPEISGQIKKIHIREGERVTKNTILVTLNKNVIQKGIDEVKIALKLAETVYKKQKELWDQKIGSEIQYLTAKTNKKSLEKKLKTIEAQSEMAIIKAPFDGIVDEIFQKEGELAIPGMRIMQLVNLSKLNINADVSEAYLSKIKKGDSVLVEFPSYPDIKLNVPVYRTGNVVKPQNRTFIVQLKINNQKEKLKPNIISILHINDYSNDSAFVVPSIIIKKDIKGDFIFLADKQGENYIANKKYIETGRSYKDKTEILKGVKKGQKVIINGYNMVSTGTEISIK